MCCSVLQCVAVCCRVLQRVAALIAPRVIADSSTSNYCRKVQLNYCERWGAGVETQKNVRGEIGGWGQVPFNEPYAPSLSTIYDGA